jgi:hypothetical protein
MSMASNLQSLPDDVRKQARKMRDLLNLIQDAPSEEVVKAVIQMNAEIDNLFTLANEASGRRV